MSALKNLGNPQNNYLSGQFQGLSNRRLSMNNGQNPSFKMNGNGAVLNNGNDPHILSNSGMQTFGFNPVADLSGHSMYKNSMVKSTTRVINSNDNLRNSQSVVSQGKRNASNRQNRELSNSNKSRSLTTRLVNDPPASGNKSQTNMGSSNKDFSLPTMSVGGKTIPGFGVKNKKIPQNVRHLMIPGMGGDPPGPQPVVAPIQFPGIINPDIYIQNTQAPPVIPQINPPPVNIDLKIKGLEEFYKKTAKPPIILNTIHHEIQNQGINEINDIANQ